MIGRPAWRPTARAALLSIILLGVVASLTYGLRRNPTDIRTGTVGKPAPTFELPRLDGEGRLSLEELRGQIVLVNFWASWCIPCKEENPALSAAWDRYRTSGVVLVGIVYQDSPEAALEYTRRYGNTWPSLLDEGGRTAIAFGVFGIPETFFIGRDGVIVGRHVGAIDYDTLARGDRGAPPVATHGAIVAPRGARARDSGVGARSSQRALRAPQVWRRVRNRR